MLELECDQCECQYSGAAGRVGRLCGDLSWVHDFGPVSDELSPLGRDRAVLECPGHLRHRTKHKIDTRALRRERWIRLQDVLERCRIHFND